MSEETTPDYKALYEQEKQHSRKWEKLAKANKNATTQLEEITAERDTAASKVAELESELVKRDAEQTHASYKAQVAKETGVPVEFIHGETVEDMTVYANSLIEHFKPSPAPTVPQAGQFAADDEKDEMREFVRNLTGRN